MFGRGVGVILNITTNHQGGGEVQKSLRNRSRDQKMLVYK